MNPVVTCAEASLRQHPDPAVRLIELLRSVAPLTDRSLTAARFRSILEDHPDRFRILDSWDSRWLESESLVPAERAWVVCLSPGTDPPAGPPHADLLRESFRSISRDMDSRSGLALIRWNAIRRAEREARQAVTSTT
jgi:hypothetical protein